MRIVVLVAPLLVGYSVRAQAGARDYQGLPVLEIQFEPEMQPLPKDEIARLLPIQAGDLLRLEVVGLAIEKLYATGRYEEITVDATRRESGVVLRFLTKGAWFAWFVGRLIVEANPVMMERRSWARSAEREMAVDRRMISGRSVWNG
ncbi:MAG: hypothetical protein JJE04_13990 [Acidobacteriia bacterium]|nr:hypothetical protein [Terriglobia bacterium]